MKNPFRSLISCVAILGLITSYSGAAASLEFPKKKVLYFSKMTVAPASHTVALRIDGKPSLSERLLEELGATHNIEFTFSKDGRLFSDDYLAQFDAIMFYTLGDLTKLGLDREPPMTLEGKAALMRVIENGTGFVGLHGADNTFLTPGSEVHGPARYKNDGDNTSDFIKMIGGEFIMHNRQQPGRMILTGPNFPGAPSGDFTLHEEWYSHRNFAPDLHVILVQDTQGMEGNLYERPNYPSTWARMHGQGRVFYTSMGHREDIWTNPLFQELLMGGLNWALKRVDADIAPNLKQVTPEAHVLPPYVPPAPLAPPKAADPIAR